MTTSSKTLPAGSPRPKKSPMADLYARLASLGYKKPYVRKVLLPDWWEDSLAENPTSLAHAELIVCRELGLEPAQLADPSIAPFALEGVEFKAREVGADLGTAVRLAKRLATIAAFTCKTPYRGDAWLDPAFVRASILASGARSVDFESLIDFCWRSGIPVVHLRNLPSGAKKPDGLICVSEGRPVIVIASQRKQVAWHLFILSHELGHLMSGHLREDGTLLDAKVDLGSDDSKEVEANRKAVELLTADEDFAFNPMGPFSAESLAAKARMFGSARRIDPGFLVLNFGHNRPGFFPAASTALNLLFPWHEAAPLYSAQYEDLDLDEVPEHTQQVFNALTS